MFDSIEKTHHDFDVAAVGLAVHGFHGGRKEEVYWKVELGHLRVEQVDHLQGVMEANWVVHLVAVFQVYLVANPLEFSHI